MHTTPDITNGATHNEQPLRDSSIAEGSIRDLFVRSGFSYYLSVVMDDDDDPRDPQSVQREHVFLGLLSLLAGVFFVFWWIGIVPHPRQP